MKIELNKKEVKDILEGLDMFRSQLKEDSTFELSNQDRFYEVWDLMDKLSGV